MKYDIIGDIHGQVIELEKLLGKLEYIKVDGIWRHESRKVIFLGDFIDRGEHQCEVIDLVRPMIDQGHALCVMGNHEYNAIAYATKDAEGRFLRKHSRSHNDSHEAFLNAFIDEKYYQETINWFKTLPLWLELDGLRVVHACWETDLISKLGNPTLTDDLIQKSAIKGSWQYDAIETILKGKEIPLPEGNSFNDKDGNPRKHIRIKYWLQEATSYRDYFMGPSSVLNLIPDTVVDGDYLVNYGAEEKPLFHGHYWMEGEIKLLTHNIACLDYSVAKEGGQLVAYRFDGETELSVDKMVFVDRA